MSKDIKEMSAEVAEKAVKDDKEVGENSLLSRALTANLSLIHISEPTRPY